MSILARETEQLNAAIDSIYAATLDQSHWPKALERVNDILLANGTCYVRSIDEGEGVTLSEVRDYGLQSRFESGFEEYQRYSKIDPRLQHFRVATPTTVITEYDFMTDEEIDRHPFYQEFMAVHDLRYTVATVMPGQQNDMQTLLAMRSPTVGPPESREMRLGKIIAAHMTRSSEIERRIAGHVTMQKMLLDSLDAVPDGLFVVQGNCRIIHANRRGRALLGAGGPLADRGSILRPSYVPDQQLWAVMISSVSKRQGERTAVPLTMKLQHPDGDPPSHATAIPITTSERHFALMSGIGEGAVLVVVSTPSAPTSSHPDRLALLFDLTPAEAKLAAGLATGASTGSYAENESLSEHTVRWTMKRLLMKTECSRQSDMVRLFTTAAAQWG